MPSLNDRIRARTPDPLEVLIVRWSEEDINETNQTPHKREKSGKAENPLKSSVLEVTFVKTDAAMPGRLFEILLATAAILFFNWMQHFPPLVQSNFSFATTDVLVEYWRNGIGLGTHLMPYVQFRFAYPAIIGFLVYLTSGLARMFSSDPFVAVDYYVCFMDLILAAFTLGTVYYVYRICGVVRRETSRIWKAFLVSPTFLLYPLFNWDMIAVFFTVLAVWYMLQGRMRYAAVSLGFGIATKIYPAMLLPVLMAEEKTWKARLTALALAALIFGTLNTPLLILNSSLWWRSSTFQVSSWGLEATWLMLFFNRFDKTAYVVGFAVMLYLVYKGLVETSRKKYPNVSDRIFQRSILMSLAWLLGSFIVPPQMALMLLPFYVLVPQVPLVLIYLEGIFNILIIPLYQYTVISLHMDARTAASPAQWSAATRQAIWLLIFIHLIYRKQTTALANRLLKALSKSNLRLQ